MHQFLPQRYILKPKTAVTNLGNGRLKDDWDIYHPLNTHPFLDELKEYSKENVELAVKTLTIVISFVPVMGEAQDVYDIGRAIVNGNVSEAVLIGILTAAPGRATALLEKGKGWLRAAGLTDDVADDVLRIADDVVGATCSFDADTLVMTEEGLVPISEIQVTDKVLAYDEVTGEMGYYPVTHVWVHDDPILIRLVIDGEVIWTTPEHPFYLGNDQWIQAGNLQKGDLVRNADWQVGVVDEVVTVYQTKPMYNLTVDTAHTYFVGEQKWLVHNGCPDHFRRGIENISGVAVGNVFQNFNKARYNAIDYAGLGDDTVDFVQEIGPHAGRVTGRMSADGLRGWRIDFDPEKGFHINWWDKTGGRKRENWMYGAIKIEGGTLDDFLNTLQHFPQS